MEAPPPFIPEIYVDDGDITTWLFLMRGPPDTPYAGGFYVGKVRFPQDYPYNMYLDKN